MSIQLSLEEISVLLGSYLMYSGVPFYRAPKRALDETEQQRIDAHQELLLEQRGKSKGHTVSIDANKDIVRLYIFILQSCLAECRGDIIDLDLHLHTRSEAVVEMLIAKLELASEC